MSQTVAVAARAPNSTALNVGVVEVQPDLATLSQEVAKSGHPTLRLRGPSWGAPYY